MPDAASVLRRLYPWLRRMNHVHVSEEPREVVYASEALDALDADAALRAQIERVVRRSSRFKHAEFWRARFFLCSVAWLHRNEPPSITTTSASMSVEHAAALSVALRMACEWIEEQRAGSVAP